MDEIKITEKIKDGADDIASILEDMHKDFTELIAKYDELIGKYDARKKQ